MPKTLWVFFDWVIVQKQKQNSILIVFRRMKISMSPGYLQFRHFEVYYLIWNSQFARQLARRNIIIHQNHRHSSSLLFLTTFLNKTTDVEVEYSEDNIIIILISTSTISLRKVVSSIAHLLLLSKRRRRRVQ
jgi:hypothetical protein